MTDPVLDPLEKRIVAVLETRPEPSVPADFAARLARQAAQPPTTRARLGAMRGDLRWSRLLTSLAVITVCAAVFLLAPHSQASLLSLRFDLELTLLAEVAGAGWWLFARRKAGHEPFYGPF